MKIIIFLYILTLIKLNLFFGNDSVLCLEPFEIVNSSSKLDNHELIRRSAKRQKSFKKDIKGVRVKMDDSSLKGLIGSKNEVKNENSMSKRRQKELDNFFRKLNESLVRISKEENIQDTDEIYSKIKTHSGNGFYVIIFDCTNPSFISHGSKVDRLPKEIANQLKKEDSCNKTDNIWRFNGEKSFLSTYDYNNNSLTDKVLPFETLFEIYNRLDLCDRFMAIMRHPSYYVDSYKKPLECRKISEKVKDKQKTTTKVLPNRRFTFY